MCSNNFIPCAAKQIISCNMGINLIGMFVDGKQPLDKYTSSLLHFDSSINIKKNIFSHLLMLLAYNRVQNEMSTYGPKPLTDMLIKASKSLLGCLALCCYFCTKAVYQYITSVFDSTSTLKNSQTYRRDKINERLIKRCSAIYVNFMRKMKTLSLI